jgi:hypothetical protein
MVASRHRGTLVANHLRAANAPWACVLDGDLQHPPEVIPRLLAAAERDRADLGDLRPTEVGFTFADRRAGESKGSVREGLTYLGALGDLRLRHGTPPAPRSVVGAELEPLAPLTRRTETVRA